VRSADLASRLATFLQPVSGARYLDLGCGGGELLALLAPGPGSWVGLDVREAKLVAARDRSPGAPLVLAKGGKLPFPDATFRGVLCLPGLARFVDPTHPLRQAARVLCPGGRLAVTTADVARGVLERALREAGLSPIEELGPALLGCTRDPGPGQPK